jgi:uncharacterized membrane protein YidH (DUF202 family)
MGDDRGLARERTTLAWRRSGLSLVALGLAVMRGVPTRDGVPGHVVAGLLVLSLGGCLFVVSSRRGVRRARYLAAARPPARLEDLAPVAVGGLLIAVTAMVIVLFR